MMGDFCTEDKIKHLIMNSENHLNLFKTNPKNACCASLRMIWCMWPSPNFTPVEERANVYVASFSGLGVMSVWKHT